VQGLVGQKGLELLALGDVADVGDVAPMEGRSLWSVITASTLRKVPSLFCMRNCWRIDESSLAVGTDANRFLT
jgi:hypothetical protein